jgi:hypothetical protein
VERTKIGETQFYLKHISQIKIGSHSRKRDVEEIFAKSMLVGTPWRSGARAPAVGERLARD